MKALAAFAPAAESGLSLRVFSLSLGVRNTKFNTSAPQPACTASQQREQAGVPAQPPLASIPKGLAGKERRAPGRAGVPPNPSACKRMKNNQDCRRDGKKNPTAGCFPWCIRACQGGSSPPARPHFTLHARARLFTSAWGSLRV